ncbi:hypothetical protein HAX54_030076 [Datura stramonium]|uniref:Uncharacterized protein n=1 Tax=Datura stramonium TaxID=4076 RepID=A0ABS8V7E4_DATST|nr:hypothetical protein [Datura stramonium]
MEVVTMDIRRRQRLPSLTFDSFLPARFQSVEEVQRSPLLLNQNNPFNWRLMEKRISYPHVLMEMAVSQPYWIPLKSALLLELSNRRWTMNRDPSFVQGETKKLKKDWKAKVVEGPKVIEVEQKVKGDMEANQETKTIVEDMNTITTGEVARTPALM